MSTPQRPGQSDFMRIATRLHRAQLAATTPAERDKANALMAEFFVYASQGRLNYWIATHDTDSPEPDPTADGSDDLGF